MVRGALPASLKRRLPYSWCIGPFPLSLAGVRFLYQGRADDSMTGEMFWTGLTVWEEETTKPFLKLIRQASLFVDIGANSGIYTLLAIAANPACEVIAVEPVPHVYQFLKDNLELNAVRARCQTICAAMADRDGKMVFHIEEDTTGGSLAPEALTKPGTLIEVDVLKVDTMLAGRKPSLIKIDVEGHEPAVLHGMNKTLEEARPSVIFECNPGGPWPSLFDLLRAHRYRVFHLVPGGKVECFSNWSTEQPNRNYLALPEETIATD
jgi:FkbM family methyltransferase